MDADDVAVPTRLERQVAFLEAHPETGIVGSAYRVIDRDGMEIGTRHMPASDTEIRWASLLSCPFAHPAAVFRHSVLLKSGLAYNPAFEPAEDYDLWTRMLTRTRGANLEEILLHYRTHDGNSSRKREQERIESHETIALRTIREQLPGFPITPEAVRDLCKLVNGERNVGSHCQGGTVANTVRLYLDLFEAFCKLHPSAVRIAALRKDVFSTVLRTFQPRFAAHAPSDIIWRVFRRMPAEVMHAFWVSARTHLSPAPGHSKRTHDECQSSP